MIRSARLPDLSGVDGIEKILIVRLKALGDIVLSLPIPRALRRRFPGARISYLCREQYAEALRGEYSLDEVIGLRKGFGEQVRMVMRLRRERFDLAIDLLSSPRSALMTFLTGAGTRVGMDVGRHNWCYHYLLPRIVTVAGERRKCYTLESNREIVRMLRLWDEEGGTSGPGAGGASGDTDGCAIGFPAAETERDWAEAYLSGLGIDRGKLVGVVPAATYQSKSWPREKFIRLVELLVERHDLVPLLIWGPGEEAVARSIAEAVPGAICAPETGIARLGALIAGSRLLITTDSGPKHIAVLQGVPTVTLFGPTDPVIWDPMNSRHRVLYLDMPCAPCRRRSCEPNRCMTGIEPEDVIEQVERILGGEKDYGRSVEDGA